MSRSPTKDQQVKHVVEGLALAVLAEGTDTLPSDKTAIALSLNSAWRAWSKADRFPSIGRSGPFPGDLLSGGICRSDRRVSVSAAWDVGRQLHPYILLEGWTPDESLDLHADERADADDWRVLAGLFLQKMG